jgi:site-specific recombinase XerD
MKTKALKSPSREELKMEFRIYLNRQRGLAEETIYHYLTFADRFLDFRFGEGPDDLSKITGTDISDFLQHVINQRRPYRNKSVPSGLRSFLRFLFQSEKIETNLAVGISRVSLKCTRRIPYHLTTEQVEELLEAAKTLTTANWKRRNYAMVLLMARLGLRTPEVIAIQMDDLDWRNGIIVIRGKGGFYDKAPLLQDIGEAIVDYLLHERQGSSRFLFVTYHPPHNPFKGAEVLNFILKKAMAKTNIQRPVPYSVSNILRHSLATNLVQKGASLEEISNTLRHRSRRTTLTYARQDINGLRTIAQSWPLQKGGLV